MLLDTSVVIILRDRPRALDASLASIRSKPIISIVSRIELENGAAAAGELGRTRRLLLSELLVDMPVLNFDRACADEYRRIVQATGFSRRKTLDRMIAATALANRYPLATVNGTDFADIPDLELEVWPTA